MRKNNGLTRFENVEKLLCLRPFVGMEPEAVGHELAHGWRRVLRNWVSQTAVTDADGNLHRVQVDVGLTNYVANRRLGNLVLPFGVEGAEHQKEKREKASDHEDAACAANKGLAALFLLNVEGGRGPE